MQQVVERVGEPPKARQITPMSLRIEWDPDRAAANESKHGVSFSEAATAF